MKLASLHHLIGAALMAIFAQLSSAQLTDPTFSESPSYGSLHRRAELSRLVSRGDPSRSRGRQALSPSKGLHGPPGPKNGPTRPTSSGSWSDSSSSPDSSPERRPAKIKAKVHGPAEVKWPTGLHEETTRTVPGGDKWKKSWRDGNKLNLEIKTHPGHSMNGVVIPPGKAKVTSRAAFAQELRLTTELGAKGRITQIEPQRKVLAQLPENTWEVRGHGSGYAPKSSKYKSEIRGPGHMEIDAEN